MSRDIAIHAGFPLNATIEQTNPLKKNPKSLISAILFRYSQMLIIKGGNKVKLIRLEVFIAVFSGAVLWRSKDEKFSGLNLGQLVNNQVYTKTQGRVQKRVS